jgi:hypothetical protein
MCWYPCAAKEQLSLFVFKLHDQGMQCIDQMVMREAVRIGPEFQEKVLQQRNKLPVASPSILD